MLFRDIIRDAAIFLKLDNVLALPQMGGSTESSQAIKELELLKKCANFVIGEIASDYVPVTKTEDTVSADNKIEYTNLSEAALDIKSLSDNFSKKLKFKVYPSFIWTDYNGKVHIEYTYLPAACELDDQTAYKSEKVSSRLIAYGTACEYCLVASMYEDAQIWDKRYKDALMSASRSGAPIRIPARRWE